MSMSGSRLGGGAQSEERVGRGVFEVPERQASRMGGRHGEDEAGIEEGERRGTTVQARGMGMDSD
jgi:hypothetical protein